MNAKTKSVRTISQTVAWIAAAVLGVGSLLISPLPAASAPLTAISAVDTATASDLPSDIVGAQVNRTIVPNDELLITRTNGAPADVNTSSQSRAAAASDSSALTLNTDPATVPNTPTRAVQSSFPTESGRFTTTDVDQVLAFQNVTVGLGSALQLSETSTYTEATTPGWDEPTALNRAPADGDTIAMGPGTIDYLAITNGPASSSAGFTTAIGSQNFGDIQGQSHVMLNQQWTVVAVSGGGFWLQSRADGSCLETFGLGETGAPLVTEPCNSTAPAQLWDFVDVSASAWQLRSHAYGSAVGSGPGPDYEPAMTDPSTLGNVGTPFYIIQEPQPVPATWAVPNSLNSENTPLDLAVGDLDNATDANLAYHDEAVVAYVGANNAVVVSVIDYNANPNHTSQLVTSVDNFGTTGSSWGPLTVDVADFDGDGSNEIAVTWTTAAGTTSVAFLRYNAGASVNPDTGAGQRTLTTASVAPLSIQPFWSTTGSRTVWADSAAWNFDLSGGADLALVYPDAQSDADQPTLSYLSFNSDLALTNTYTVPIPYAATVVPGFGQHDTVVIDTGAFDPKFAGQPGNRQLAIAVPYQDGSVGLNIWEYTPAQGETPQSASIIAAAPPYLDSNYVFSGSWGLDMATGAFGDPTGPQTWSVMLTYTTSYVTVPAPSAWIFTMNIAQDNSVTSYRTLLEQIPNIAPVPAAFPGHYSLTSYDRTGQSLILGAPLVFTVDQLKQLDLVAGQPPGHADWLNGGFQNISRTDGFNVNIGSTSSAGFSNTSSHSSDQSYAVSQTESLTATTKVGIPLIASGQFSLNVAENFNKTWDTKKSSLSQFSSTTSKAVTEATADDDIVNAEVQTFRVLRYPVIGTTGRTDSSDDTCNSGCTGYWEVTIPGATEALSGGGKSMDFFQPDWSNGNALSYPAIDNGTIDIPDLGNYTSNGTTSNTPLIDDIRQLGGTSATVQLNISDSSSTTNSESTSQSWNAGVDVTTTVKAGVGVPGEGQETINNQLSVGFNAANSFTDSTTGDTTNAHGQSFGLTVPSIDDDYEYTIGTAYYYTTGGYPKVAYAVDLTDGAESNGFWGANYGVNPDPALNLPFASLTVDNPVGVRNIPEWDPVDTAQIIRGFVARQPIDPTSPTTSGAPYASAPANGAPVIFDIPVHNYSLVDLTAPLDVSFYAVPVDTRNADVTGSPISLGSTNWTGGIPAQGEVTISSPNWSAIAGTGGALQQYRVFAVLDPGNTINEVHGWAGNGSNTCPTSSVQGGTPLIDPMTGGTSTLECGQNNQGYGLVTVGGTPTPSGPANVSLNGGAIRAGNADAVELNDSTAVPAVQTGTRLTGYVDVRADSDSTEGQTVLVYDGKPTDGKLIASTTIHGVDAQNGGSASFNWTPEEPGLHELHQVILGTQKAGPRDEQIMRVQVTGDSGTGGGGAATPPPSAEGGGATPPPSDASHTGALAATGSDIVGSTLLALVIVIGGVIMVTIRRRRFGNANPGTPHHSPEHRSKM